MAHTAKTALLNQSTWDLQLDVEGNIVLCTGDKAIAQNCANEIRLWKKDAYFQQDNGVSYQEAILAQKVNPSMFKQLIREACLRVDGVTGCDTVEIVSFDTDTRVLHGYVEIQTENGTTEKVGF